MRVLLGAHANTTEALNSQLAELQAKLDAAHAELYEADLERVEVFRVLKWRGPAGPAHLICAYRDRATIQEWGGLDEAYVHGTIHGLGGLSQLLSAAGKKTALETKKATAVDTKNASGAKKAPRMTRRRHWWRRRQSMTQGRKHWR